jgi:AraC-like DNA-binding protein/quercetin dioxygenase-like cupin family protein
MLQKRQTPVSEFEGGYQIRSHAFNCPDGMEIEAHSHTWHQLVYASRGAMSVNTAEGSWIVPSKRAVWMPAGVEHALEMIGAVWVRTLYLRPDVPGPLPEHCHVIEVTPFFRELILHTLQTGILDRNVPAHRRLIGVIVDQLNAVAAVPLKLPLPTDPRALRIAEALRNDPSNNITLDDLSRTAGASKRTIERLFVTETEMTFGKWRQQMRLMHALRLLALGESVTTAALEVGYDSTSAFIAAFKSVLGTTPGQYYGNPQPHAK